MESSTDPALRGGSNAAVSNRLETLQEQLATMLRTIEQAKDALVVQETQLRIGELEIRHIVKFRRNRSRFFDKDLFADPAWDLLLELYQAALGQFKVSVSSLCVAAAVPATTALRWIKSFEDKGLVTREVDPTDRRRQFVMLSVEAREAMDGYFRTVSSPALPV